MMTSSRRASRTAGRRRRLIVGGSIALVVVAVGVVAAIAFVPRGTATPERTPESVASPTRTPIDRCAGADDIAPASGVLAAATSSDEFDEWEFAYLPSGPQLQASATSTRHGGLAALALTSGAALVQPHHLRQDLRLVEGETYRVSFWARTVDVASASVSVELGPLNNERGVSVGPVGADWTLFEFAYTIPAGFPDVHLQIQVDDLVGEIQFDDVSVLAGQSAEQLANGDFEWHSSSLSLDNSSLLLSEDASESLQLRTRYDGSRDVAWCITSPSGTPVRSEVASLTGALDIPVVELDAGLYTFSATVVVDGVTITRQARFGLLEEAAEPTSRYGVAGHIAGSERRIVATPDLIASMGLGGMRAELPWDRIEVTPGVYEYPRYVAEAMAAYQAAGISVSMVPAYYNPNYDGGRTPSSPTGLSGYAAFAADLAARFPGVGNSIEVYNEYDHFFNNGACGHTPECYMELLIPTRDAVKSVAPDMPVVGPSTAGMGVRRDWLDPFMQIGGLDAVDALTFHPYTQPEAPDQLIEPLTEFNADLAGRRPIWVTEMGWSSATDWVTEEQQTAYIARMMLLAPALGIERTYLFTIADMTDDPASRELRFGMFDPPTSFTPRTYPPAESAYAVAVAAGRLEGATAVSIETDAGVRSIHFEAADGTPFRAIWSTNDETVVLPEDTFIDTTVRDVFGQPVDVTGGLPVGALPFFVIADEQEKSSE